MRSPGPYPPEWDGPILRALECLRSNPFPAANSPPFDDTAFSWCHQTAATVVRSMTIRDLYTIDLAVKLNLTLAERELYHELIMDESPFAIFSAPSDWLRSTVNKDCVGLTPIMIDLDFPNKVVREHFESHLQELRRQTDGRPKEAKKHSPDLDHWGKAGLLPCMDLLLLEKQLDTRIPDSVLANAVGPEGQVDREMIRKTVRPLAEALISKSDDFLRSRLHALAYWSLASRAEAKHRHSAKRQSKLSKNSTTGPK